MSVLDEIEEIGGDSESGRSVEELCRGEIRDRVRTAKRLTLGVEFQRMWAASARALSVREALLRNSSAPDELYQRSWEELRETARVTSFQRNDQKVKLLHILMGEPRASELIREELIESASGVILFSAALLMSGLSFEERAEALAEMDPSVDSVAQAALWLYARSELTGLEMSAATRALAAYETPAAHAFGLVEELAANRGGFASALGGWVRAESETNQDAMDKMSRLVRTRISSAGVS